MKLDYEGIKNRSAWEEAGIALPAFDAEAVAKKTLEAPAWVHFGAGSLFRAFHAMVAQELLEKGRTDRGVIVAETFDYEMVETSYAPYDNLGISVSLMPDGKLIKNVIGSVAASFKCDDSFGADMEALKQIFRNSSLQMVTFTITEKGYALRGMDGEYTPLALDDFTNGPKGAKHAMSKACSLLYERYLAGGTPLAMVSTDNCSSNGEKLKNSIVAVAREWSGRGLVKEGFLEWVSDETKVSFPWTTIDKITPRPDAKVAAELEKSGVEGMDIRITAKKGYTAAFVNAEKPRYLVIEDRFPNGRPALEEAGVYMTDRDTVNKFERMKVCTCLNPLHTALAVFGCLLGYKTIASEMQSAQLGALVRRIGLDEGMKTVTDPGIIRPSDFITEVIESRFPNPYMPDTPQRIACDTSQKVPIRFGETIKSYASDSSLDVKELTFIPLAIAGWMRYLLGVDDNGNVFECSPDPMLEELQGMLKGVSLGKPESATIELLAPILSNKTLFANDLCELGLAPKICGMLAEMLEGPGAVLAVLKKYVQSA